MNRYKASCYVLFIIFCFNVISLQAREAYFPKPGGKVVSDYHHLLNETQTEDLAQLIRGEYENSSNQLAIVLIPTHYLGELSIEEYAHQLFNQWALGQKKLNNGVLLIVTGSRQDSIGRKVRIEVGSGLEGVLPDAMCNRILTQLLIPELKQYRYYEALLQSSKAILACMHEENQGRRPMYKKQIDEHDLLRDEAGLLSPDEFRQLAKRLEQLQPAVLRPNLIYLQEHPLSNHNFYFAEASTSFPLFALSVNMGVSFVPHGDSIRILRQDPIYALTAHCDLSADPRLRHEYEDQIRNLMIQQKPCEALQKCVDLYELSFQPRKIIFYKLLASHIGLIIIMLLLYVLIKWKKAETLRKHVILKIGVIILLLLIFFLGILSIFSAEMAWVLPISSYLFWTTGQQWLWGILFAFMHVVMIVLYYPLSQFFMPGFWRGGGGSSGSDSSYSGSATSSQSYSSSSYSSGSSSSSNSGYSGGGGSSGGGGASGSW
ncbi:MAG: TPM domain-containing protein [Chitinophagaceae bacterium]|nr:TPM domain-containing protein [Chitinophagaceae bacterium]